jgi:hypothetical protein
MDLVVVEGDGQLAPNACQCSPGLETSRPGIVYAVVERTARMSARQASASQASGWPDWTVPLRRSSPLVPRRRQVACRLVTAPA